MVAYKRKRGLAVLVAIGVAVFGTNIFLWPIQAVERQEIRPQETGKDSALGAEGSTPGVNRGVSAQPTTRHAFAKAMAKIKAGMAEKEVLGLLGKPDDVQTQHDPAGISTADTKEIWRYGTNGHLTFPTLGCVYIDTNGKVQYVYGGYGEPPDPKMFSETTLRSLLCLIDQAPSYNSGYHFNPLAVIQIVNALQPLGKDNALAAIDEYLRVASTFHSPARDGVFLVLRVLFDVPADLGHMPKMKVGTPSHSAPMDAKKLPRFPILLQDDMPLLLVEGYELGGVAEQPESHVKYFRTTGKLRERPLAPTNAPLALLDSWAKTVGWLYDENSAVNGKMLMANQLLNLVDSVYRRDAGSHGYKFWPKDDVDGQWKLIQGEVVKLDIRWNATKNLYTFKDGTHLPAPTKKLYQRHIWTLMGLNGDAQLILERTNKKKVQVILTWSGRTQEMPSYVLEVFAVKNKAQALTQLKPVSISAVPGDGALTSQSCQVNLADGEEVQARLKIGQQEQLSPVYRP